MKMVVICMVVVRDLTNHWARLDEPSLIWVQVIQAHSEAYKYPR